MHCRRPQTGRDKLVAALTDKTSRWHVPEEVDRVDALAVGAIGTRPRARCAGCRLVEGPVFVVKLVAHHRVAGERKRWWNVVLASRSLGLITREDDMW